MTRRWVFNASPLILLGKAGELHWVPLLGEVVIPGDVAREILAASHDDAARIWIENKGAGLVRQSPVPSDDLLSRMLGAGETSVISWAAIHPGYEAVLDDAAARRAGRAMKIPLRGTLSLVVLAKRRGFLPACAPVFVRLRQVGLYVTESLVAQALEAAGE